MWRNYTARSLPAPRCADDTSKRRWLGSSLYQTYHWTEYCERFWYSVAERPGRHCQHVRIPAA